MWYIQLSGEVVHLQVRLRSIYFLCDSSLDSSVPTSVTYHDILLVHKVFLFFFFLFFTSPSLESLVQHSVLSKSSLLTGMILSKVFLWETPFECGTLNSLS